MPLPSAVTLGSLALVVAAGAGLGVVTSSAGDDSHSELPAAKSVPSTAAPTSDDPAPPPHRRPRQDPVPKTLVDVFNNSGVSGLAARKAARLSGAGWTVAATDNWYGDIPADTVYFPRRLHDDALALAKTLHITRLHRAVAPMQFDRLTVILTGR
jgi:hypothetical protein